MYGINKITSHPTVDFAAEELKKYLRMMMPRCGEILIKYAPDANGGFRLGLMADFGIDTSEAPDIELDDILYIDTDTRGGIIAGSNPRSVLLAVYKYLTLNGCRWLFPGIDGELIPIKNIEPTKYHKMADCRFRGQCNEGAEAQHLMMEAIDFAPKIGMNVFMMEFDNPRCYYDTYYYHTFNTENRTPEPVSPETVLQWKRQCEVEIAKRGLQFHDIGHGWTAEAFGIDTSDGWVTHDDGHIPEESRQFVAMVDGKRGLHHGIALATNFCMSCSKARGMVVNRIADYAERATNVDYLHVWLADGRNGHCECEECRKKIPSDWYVIMLNELDTELTRRQLATRIVLICYTDTTWAPKTAFIKNPGRFSLLVAAINRDFTKPLSKNVDISKIVLPPFELNKTLPPKSFEEYIAHQKRWEKTCSLKSFAYEYHFWWPGFRDLGLFGMTKVIHDDIVGYKSNGFYGVIEDGSQRSFFPNGLAFFVFSSTLFDTAAEHEELVTDYFSHAYGEDYKEVIEFFVRLGDAVPFAYLSQKEAKDGAFYKPEIVNSLKKVEKIVADFLPFVESHKNMPYRAQTVAYRILEKFLGYAKGVASALILKALGKEHAAKAAFERFRIEFGKHELSIERYFDHRSWVTSFSRVFYQISGQASDTPEDIVYMQ